MNWSELRVKRLRNRVTKREIARRLGCAESWLNVMELYGYNGPAREVWAEKYRVALEDILAERKAR